VSPTRLNNTRDGNHFALLGYRQIDDHVHHFVDHGVELIALNAVSAIEAAREVRVLITTQDVNLTDQALGVKVGHAA
jgi:hypothetical protein